MQQELRCGCHMCLPQQPLFLALAVQTRHPPLPVWLPLQGSGSQSGLGLGHLLPGVDGLLLVLAAVAACVTGPPGGGSGGASAGALSMTLPMLEALLPADAEPSLAQAARRGVSGAALCAAVVAGQMAMAHAHQGPAAAAAILAGTGLAGTAQARRCWGR